MPRIVFLDLESTHHNDLNLKRLQDCGELITYPFTNAETIHDRINDADIIITNKVIIDKELLEAFRDQIKLICVAATGTNNVDLEAAKQYQIPVTNVRNYGTQSVAEHVISLIFALNRRIPQFQYSIQQGEWQHSQHFCLLGHPIREVAGLNLVIIGYGTLGQATAQLAQNLGMNIFIAERPGQTIREGRISFEEGLKIADVLSLHCPLTPETENLITSKELTLMKPDATLINTARGGIVNEQDLVNALKMGEIGGAGMDVLTKEPPKEGNVLLEANLANLVLTPHIAWASQRARQTLVDQLADIIEAYKQGEWMNRVI